MTATVAELQPELERWVTTRARELEVPGVAVGVLLGGEESYAYHGVTTTSTTAAASPPPGRGR
jgi:hypothetical protein